MNKMKFQKPDFIRIVIWGIILYSLLALVYHVRWFIPYLQNGTAYVVPDNQLPVLWFAVQILTNIIFIYVGYLLIRLFQKYRDTGYFDTQSLKVFNVVILSCLCLALLGAIQTVSNNFSEVHAGEWTSLESAANLLFRSVTTLLILREPQSMYFLLAIILWVVRQFVTKALYIKKENEAII